MRRPLLLAVAALGGLLLPSSAQAATTIATGVLRDAGGEPQSGTLTAFGWGRHRGEQPMPVVGRGRAGSDGRYAVQVTDQAAFEGLAAQREGSLDLLLRADDGRALGETVTTTYTPDAGARASAAGVARVAGSADIVTKWTRPQATAAQLCLPPKDSYIDDQTAPVVIGELNHAYRDSRANWAYGSRADSNITVAVRPDGKGFSAGGTVKVDNNTESTDDINGIKGPFARQIKSDFRFVRYYVRSQCPGVPDSEKVRAEEWVGGIDFRTQQRGTLRVCPTERNRRTARYERQTGFRRAKTAAVTWSKGASAYGFGFDVQSGFSKWVRQSIRFGGPTGKVHYICGSRPGGPGPKYAPRIFSGGAPSR